MVRQIRCRFRWHLEFWFRFRMILSVLLRSYLGRRGLFLGSLGLRSH